MVCKCKIIETVNATLHWHCTHVYKLSQVIGINRENNICLLNKVTSVFMDDKKKYGCQCIVHMHITSELKA